MTAKYVETFRGVVYPWHCDHQDHMTVMHYVGMFDAAFWQHVGLLGFTPEMLAQTNRGFADVKDVLEYKAELPVGSLVVIDSCLTRIGGKSITAKHRMFNCASESLAATSEKTSAFFDLSARKAIALPDELRSKMEEHLGE